MIPLEPLPWACGEVAGVEAFNTLRGTVDPNDPYSQYSLCDYRNDSPARVAATRAALCRQLGIGDDRLVSPVQTHSACAVVVDEALLSLSPQERRKRLTGVDALVTQLTGVCIGVNTADCVNLVLTDPQARIIGVAHGGWKGTAARIAAATVRQMAALGADPRHIQATMGASICQDCFEVGDEVVEAFASQGFDTARIMRRNAATGKAHISLRTATAITLAEAGVPAEAIVNTHRCTRCHPRRYFSARRLGVDSGRVFTGIIMR